MIEIEHIVYPSSEQMEFIVEGMRNPMNSWDKSDSKWELYESDKITTPEFQIGEKDVDLMMRLRNAGTEHRKYMRQIPIMMRITAPLFWWKEFDTYKVGTTANSCSTMHKIAEKEFTLKDFTHEHIDMDYISMIALETTIDALNAKRSAYLEFKDKDDWRKMIELLPSSYNQTRNVTMNYEVLCNIYHQRKNHKLYEWRRFCGVLETLRFAQLITGDEV